MTNHVGSYGTGKTYSSFKGLVTRAKLPYVVYQFLKYDAGYTGMRQFCSQETLGVINSGYARNMYNNDDRCQAISCWNAARKARTDLRKNPEDCRQVIDEIEAENGDSDMIEEKMVNADRNEMVALLQGAKGAQFVRVHMQYSRLDDHDEQQKRVGPKLTFKAVDLDLAEGDYVIVQYRERLGIGIVDKVFADAPTSDEYDYRQQLKHVVQKIDVQRSKQLTELDRQMLKKITASEAQDRMERLTRQLGIAIDQVTLELPKLD